MYFRMVIFDGEFRITSLWYDASKFKIQEMIDVMPQYSEENWMLEYSSTPSY